MGVVMWQTRTPSFLSLMGLTALFCCLASSAIGQSSAPHRLVAEADRFAWLRAWTRAEPLYAEARKAFVTLGDRRNALYAEVCLLRCQLPTLAVPEVSERLAAYLDDPLVQNDDRLRLRVLVIKGETDADLDPALSQRSWTEALAIAEKLGEDGWANRARAEIGVAAFLQGDTNTAVVSLSRALKVAEATQDTSSLVRWLTLFGHGFAQLGRHEQALDFYDRALQARRGVPELQFPVMTYAGKADVLTKLGRVDEAEVLVREALGSAEQQGSLGYQAELTMRLGLIAETRKQTAETFALMARATALARRAGGHRALADIALDHARALRAVNRLSEAETTLRAGIAASRQAGERLMLPRLLAQLADVELSRGRHTRAAELLREADDLLEGLLTHASSPWVRGRIVAGMDDVVAARIRLEGKHAKDPSALFAVVERARGRSLVELLHARPLSQIQRPDDLRAGERQIASLQRQLLRAKTGPERERLLDDVFLAEQRLADLTTELFARSQRSPRTPISLRAVQRTLRSDELLIEYVLAEPTSFALAITTSHARVVRLSGRSNLISLAAPFASAARAGGDVTDAAAALAEVLLPHISELTSRKRLVISAEGILQHVPFELLPTTSGLLLDTHVVSYTQSATILALLRSRAPASTSSRAVLAVGSSPTLAIASAASAATRGVSDLDVTKLPPLRFAAEEARFVGTAFGEQDSTTLVGASATEEAFKSQPLADYRVLHVAAHGIVSTKMPARSALLLQASGAEDGVLQAREVLSLRLNSTLVTLSACDTSAGTEHGQDGVASLVRPFVAAGARAVVANLWAADDAFSSSLMREFYRELSTGIDIGESLRRAKRTMIARFGPAATPQLWSGVLAFGDTAQTVVPRQVESTRR